MIHMIYTHTHIHIHIYHTYTHSHMIHMIYTHTYIYTYLRVAFSASLILLASFIMRSPLLAVTKSTVFASFKFLFSGVGFKALGLR